MVGEFLEAHLNLDLLKRWIKEKWKSKGKVEVIAMLNSFMMFNFTHEKYWYNILSCDLWVFEKWDFFKINDIQNLICLGIKLPQL